MYCRDLAVYKPVGMRTDDIIDIYKSFYGSEGGEACTFAPERFVDGGDVQPEVIYIYIYILLILTYIYRDLNTEWIYSV